MLINITFLKKIKKQKLTRIKCEKNDVKRFEKNNLIDKIDDYEMIKKKEKKKIKKNIYIEITIYINQINFKIYNRYLLYNFQYKYYRDNINDIYKKTRK